MKKEYVIIKTKHPSKDKEKIYFKLRFKNQYTDKVEKTRTALDDRGLRIEIYKNKNLTPQMRKVNTLAEQKLKKIIADINYKRDVEGVTLQQILDDVKIESKLRGNPSFYSLIDKLWVGINDKQKQNFKSFIKNHYPLLKQTAIKNVCNSEFIRKYSNHLEKLKKEGLNGGYVAKFWFNFVDCIQQALDDGYVDKLPRFKKIAPKSVIKRETKAILDYAKAEHLKALDELDVFNKKTLQFVTDDVKLKMDTQRRAYLFSAIYCGLRPTTMQLLKWKHIVDKGTHFEVYTKTDGKTNTDLYVWVQKEAVEYIGERKGKEDYVFPDYYRGESANRSRTFKMLKHHAGIDYPELSFKSCRHTHAYRTLKASDNNIWKVKERLAHSNVQTTLDYYARFDDEFHQEGLDELSKIDKYDVKIRGSE